MSSIVVESSITKEFPPDIVKFGIHITKVASNSRELTAYNKDKIAELVEVMRELDIEDENLEESYFRITVNREQEGDKYVEAGFKLDAGYTITTYLDYELMGDIREKLTELELEFSIDYALEDESDIRDMLLGEAVKSSKKKASIIAQAADREVGDLKGVKYNDTGRRPMMMAMRSNAGEAAPHNIEITESIEAEWELD